MTPSKLVGTRKSLADHDGCRLRFDNIERAILNASHGHQRILSRFFSSGRVQPPFLAASALRPFPRRKRAGGARSADRSRQDLGHGDLADRPGSWGEAAAAARLCGRSAGRRGPSDDRGREAARRPRGRSRPEARAPSLRAEEAADLHPARPVRRQPRMVGGSDSTGHRRRNCRHDRLAPSVLRLRRVAEDAALSCGLPGSGHPGRARRGASRPAFREAARGDRAHGCLLAARLPARARRERPGPMDPRRTQGQSRSDQPDRGYRTGLCHCRSRGLRCRRKQDHRLRQGRAKKDVEDTKKPDKKAKAK